MGSPATTAAHKRRKAPECETCFKRRIKCDGQRPECRKCVAKGLQCPGILDEFDLKFRDQSQAVKKRVEKKVSSTTVDQTPSPGPKRASKSQSSSPVAPSVTHPANQKNVPRSRVEHAGASRQLVPLVVPTIQHSVHLSPGTFTTGLFFDGHQNMLGSSGAADPWIAYMKPAVAKAEPKSPLHLAAEAMSLAVFGHRSHQREAVILAMDKYVCCMSALRSAISDPVEAAADSTLMTVLLLTIYEYVTSSDQQGKERFCRHADGVVALAVYRRRTGSVFHQQLQMFWIVITSMVMRYTYIGKSRILPTRSSTLAMNSPGRKITIPKQDNVRNWITRLTATSPDPAGRLFELMLASVVLRTKSRDLHLPPVIPGSRMAEEVGGVFADALSMHDKLNSWGEDLPCELRPQANRSFRPVIDEDLESSEIWQGRLLTFSNLDAACTYNQWRSLQIVVLGIAIRNLHWQRVHLGTVDREVQYESLCAALYDQIDGMCASVPYFLGLKHSIASATAMTGAQHVSLDGRGALSIAVMLQFCLLVEGIPSTQRRWIQGRLKYIAEHVGVRYATVGAKAESPCLLFEGDPVMVTTFRARGHHALTTASLSVRSASASPLPST